MGEHDRLEEDNPVWFDNSFILSMLQGENQMTSPSFFLL